MRITGFRGARFPRSKDALTGNERMSFAAHGRKFMESRENFSLANPRAKELQSINSSGRLTALLRTKKPDASKFSSAQTCMWAFRLATLKVWKRPHRRSCKESRLAHLVSTFIFPSWTRTFICRGFCKVFLGPGSGCLSRAWSKREQIEKHCQTKSVKGQWKIRGRPRKAYRGRR